MGGGVVAPYSGNVLYGNSPFSEMGPNRRFMQKTVVGLFVVVVVVFVVVVVVISVVVVAFLVVCIVGVCVTVDKSVCVVSMTTVVFATFLLVEEKDADIFNVAVDVFMVIFTKLEFTLTTEVEGDGEGMTIVVDCGKPGRRFNFCKCRIQSERLFVDGLVVVFAVVLINDVLLCDVVLINDVFVVVVVVITDDEGVENCMSVPPNHRQWDTTSTVYFPIDIFILMLRLNFLLSSI